MERNSDDSFEQALTKSQSTLGKKKTRELHPFTTEASQSHPKPQLAVESFLTLRSRLERKPEVGCTGTQKYFETCWRSGCIVLASFCWHKALSSLVFIDHTC